MTRQESEAQLTETYEFFQRLLIGKSDAQIDQLLLSMPPVLEELDEADVYAQMFAQQNNMRVITPNDRSGRMSRFEFDGIQSLWTGIANPCVSVLVAHPAFGAAGSHLKTLTKEGLVAFLRNALKSPVGTYMQQMSILENPDDYEMKRQLVPLKTRETILKEAIDVATSEFQNLRPGRLPKGTTISITGIRYSTAADINHLRKIAINHSKTKGDIECHPEYIGLIGGMAYGGLMHPSYSQPTFIPFA